MRSLGKRLLVTDKDATETNIFRLAATGNIVTPITSFIVLENETDYHKFGIHKNKKSLEETNLQTDNSKSFSIKQGTVPEPEEWMIAIICFLIIYIWTTFLL